MRKLVSLWVMLAFFSVSFSDGADARQAATAGDHLDEQNTMSVLWFQTSGELKALYYQGYNIGKLRLDEILRKKAGNHALKPAIVLDIDETIVDNSPYYAWKICHDRDTSMTWNKWIDRAEAKPLPGAVNFLNYAASRGVEIFYISNRNEEQKGATVRNLKKIGAPMADSEHVLLQRSGEQGKEARRSQVARSHDIILLFGDNLGDFSGFDQLSQTARGNTVEKLREEFGKKLIVFPNPMYGDWEGAIYQYDPDKSDAEKAQLRRAGLKPCCWQQ